MSGDLGQAGGPRLSAAHPYLAGNRTSASLNGVQQASYTYNAANEVTNAGWAYDAAGNLTSDGVTGYTFDALGRLTGTNASSETQSYAYNGDGTLVSATANGTSTSYTQDLAGGMTQILASTSGGITSDYLRDDGGNLVASLTNSAHTWYGTDNQGSVRQTLDDTGAVLATQSYDPYGQPETTGQVGSFGYTGELQDSTTGAVDLRARWYQPGTGALLGVDPMLDTTGQAYGYAGGDPVNGSDPSGDCAVDTVPVSAAGICVPGALVAFFTSATPTTVGNASLCSSQGSQAGGTGLAMQPASLSAAAGPASNSVRGNPRDDVLSVPIQASVEQGDPTKLLPYFGTEGGADSNLGYGVVQADMACSNQGQPDGIDQANPDYGPMQPAIVVPLRPGGARCAAGTNLPAGRSLLVVAFGNDQENHSMIFTTDGMGNFAKFEGLCTVRPAHGQTTDKSPGCNPGQAASGDQQLYYRTSVQTYGHLATDSPGLAHARDEFVYQLNSPMATADAYISAMGRRVNAAYGGRGIDYRAFMSNCHTFTYTALIVLGLAPTMQLYDIETIGWGHPLPGVLGGG